MEFPTETLMGVCTLCTVYIYRIYIENGISFWRSHALRFSFGWGFFGFKEWSRFWEEDVVYVRPPWGSQAPLMRGKPTYDKQDSKIAKPMKPMTNRIVKYLSKV